MKTYGKWEIEHDANLYGGTVRRHVKQVGWFGVVREWWEWVVVPRNYCIDNRRLCRALNNDPEPVAQFSTDALKAELKRRGEKKL